MPMHMSLINMGTYSFCWPSKLAAVLGAMAFTKAAMLSRTLLSTESLNACLAIELSTSCATVWLKTAGVSTALSTFSGVPRPQCPTM